MKIITINVNGIKSAISKGFKEWISNQNPDVVCLQEIRTNQEQINNGNLEIKNFKSYFKLSSKNGYSGVGLYLKKNPSKINNNFGEKLIDEEGRFIAAEYKDLLIASIYMPSGTSGEKRQNIKYIIMKYVENWMRAIKNKFKEIIICGDFNIAHKEIDLKNWKNNKKNSGFLLQEREWMTKIFGNLGFIDTFRNLNQNPHQYTWWSNRGKAWENNVGWRIDYQIATDKIAKSSFSSSIYKNERFSDHAPLIINYKYDL